MTEVGEVLLAPHPFAGLRRNGYRCVMADPPTTFYAGTRSRPQHYQRMTDHAIAALPVQDLMHPDGCWLALWVTSPKLYRPPGSKTRLRPDELAAAWGCRYSGRGFVWVKLRRRARGRPQPMDWSESDLHHGLGLTTNKNVEDILLFRRGKPLIRRGQFEVIVAPRREHSRKPDEIYDRIERFTEGPFCELFARHNDRPGWAFWGLEVERFNRERGLLDGDRMGA